MKVGERRWAFLVETLTDLDKSLREKGSRLYIVRSKPEEFFEKLSEKVGGKVSQDLELHAEADYEPYAQSRDEKVTSILQKRGVKFNLYAGNSLYDPNEVIKRNEGSAPLRYQKFQDIVGQLKVKEAFEAPEIFPPINEEILESFRDFSGPRNDFGIFNLEELGFKEGDNFCGNFRHYGGESEALKRLNAFIRDKNRVRTYAKPSTSPAAFNPVSTTALSPYLKFGCLSSRYFYHKVMEIQKELGKSFFTQPPVSLIGQLLWRDFYISAGYATPNYDRMENNPICIQIDWKCQDMSNASEDDRMRLKAWSEGKTGFPWIDAIMTQLRTEGWIHHLARHSAACFLTRGDLFISWERGKEVFEELLLDADWALNAGNWMWLSASAFFYQYFRVYSPIAFGKKYDSKGKYVRKYLPVLKKVPDAYIYEPWKMPIAVQKSSNCIIGKDYPRPIVDHDESRAKCISWMKEAYAGNKERKETQVKSSPSSSRKRKEGSTTDGKKQLKLDDMVMKIPKNSKK